MQRWQVFLVLPQTELSNFFHSWTFHTQDIAFKCQHQTDISFPSDAEAHILPHRTQSLLICELTPVRGVCLYC